MKTVSDVIGFIREQRHIPNIENSALVDYINTYERGVAALLLAQYQNTVVSLEEGITDYTLPYSNLSTRIEGIWLNKAGDRRFVLCIQGGSVEMEGWQVDENRLRLSPSLVTEVAPDDFIRVGYKVAAPTHKLEDIAVDASLLLPLEYRELYAYDALCNIAQLQHDETSYEIFFRRYNEALSRFYRAVTDRQLEPIMKPIAEEQG